MQSLSVMFRELRVFADALLDRDLPNLCKPENEEERMSRYPMQDLVKLRAVLEKYQGLGMADKIRGKGGAQDRILQMDKREVAALLTRIKGQI